MSVKDADFLKLLIGALVDYPEAVRVEKTTDERGVLLTLQVHQSDMGKVIGKEGACAQALRIILRAVGMKDGARVNLKILEPETMGQATMREAMQDVRSAVQ